MLVFVEPSAELWQQIRAQHGLTLAAGSDLPSKSLRGFQRVSLPAGGSQDLIFQLDAADFSYAYAGGACISSVGLQLLPWCWRPLCACDSVVFLLCGLHNFAFLIPRCRFTARIHAGQLLSQHRNQQASCESLKTNVRGPQQKCIRAGADQ